MQTVTISPQLEEDKQILVIALVSLLLGLVCMILGSVPVLGDKSLLSVDALRTWGLRHPPVLRTVFDALIWQWATGILFLVFYYRDWQRLRSSRVAALRTLGMFTIMIVAVMGTFLIRQKLLRISWMNFQPDAVLGEGYVTTFLYSVVERLGFRVKDTTGLAASSGFVSLQVMMLLGMWLHAHKRAQSAVSSPLWWSANAFALVLVITSRLLLGGHTATDVLLGIAVGIFGFWAAFSIMRGARGQLSYLANLAVPSLSYFLVGLFFCHDPALWLWLGFSGACALAILFLWFSARPPLKRAAKWFHAGEGNE